MSDNTKVDWTQPIEAVGPKGEVAPIELDPNYQNPNPSGHYTLLGLPAEGCYYTYTADGLSWMGDGEDGWRIRNVAQTTRTTDEQLTHYAERCKALVERMAAVNSFLSGEAGPLFVEARAVVASMVEVDGDLVEAKRIKQEAYDADRGSMPEDWITVAVANGIRRGRALERGE